MLRRILSMFGLKKAPVRQTSIGLAVPYLEASTREQLLENLEYVQHEIDRLGITYVEDCISTWDLSRNDFSAYVWAAKAIASDAAAPILSPPALAFLPAINPYAERLYNYEEEFVDINDIGKAAQVGRTAALELGAAILKVDPLAKDEKGRYVRDTHYDIRCLNPIVTK